MLLIDQFTKWLVVQNMVRYESIPVLGDWLKLTYTRNPGMAFGISFGPPWTVTVLAVVATLLICVYMWTVRRTYTPFRYSLALILGGALGNIIDRVAYGVLYDGLGWFQGQVVDFVHVDLYNDWVDLPLLGNRYVSLFPIWNVADMAIVGGVIGFMAFQGRFHRSLAAALAPPTELGAATADGEATPQMTAASGAASTPEAMPVSTFAPPSESVALPAATMPPEGPPRP